MLAPSVLLCLIVVSGNPGPGAWAANAPKAEVISVSHPQALLGGQRQAPHVRQRSPRQTSDGVRARLVLEKGQLVAHATERAPDGGRQEGLGADAGDGGGDGGGAAVQEGVVLRQPSAQPARTQAGRAGLGGRKVHGGGVGSLVGHPRPGGQGGLGELPAAAAGRANT